MPVVQQPAVFLGRKVLVRPAKPCLEFGIDAHAVLLIDASRALRRIGVELHVQAGWRGDVLGNFDGDHQAADRLPAAVDEVVVVRAEARRRWREARFLITGGPRRGRSKRREHTGGREPSAADEDAPRQRHGPECFVSAMHGPCPSIACPRPCHGTGTHANATDRVGERLAAKTLSLFMGEKIGKCGAPSI